MARHCTICAHPDREAIDKALLEGKLSNRRIAAQCAVTENALRRHVAAGHLPQHLAKAQQAGEVAKADTLLARLKALNAETRDILSEARAGQDNELALKAIARCEKQLELEARLLGELHEQTTINVLLSTEWLTLQTTILATLEPYPEARLRLAEALNG